MKKKIAIRSIQKPGQRGMSLLETLVALAILLTVSVGILSMASLAMSTTENQGHLAARTAEYAQDKMEQLMSLSFGDTTSDTTAFPSASSGGTGLAVGGSSDTSHPVATPGTGYVDYLDISGQPVASTGAWYYERVWQVTNPSTNLKQITVTATVKAQVGAPAGALPKSTLVCIKTSPF